MGQIGEHAFTDKLHEEQRLAVVRWKCGRTAICFRCRLTSQVGAEGCGNGAPNPHVLVAEQVVNVAEKLLLRRNENTKEDEFEWRRLVHPKKQ